MKPRSFFLIRALLAACLALSLLGCADKRAFVWGSKLPTSSARARPLGVGDKIQVLVHGQEAMSGEFEVRPGGEIVIPVIGRFPVAGKDPDQVAQQLAQHLSGVLENPRVAVVTTLRRTSVSVIGEVDSPGSYELRDGDGLLAALARAGGITEFADPDSIFVLRRDSTGPRIRFRYVDLTGSEPASTRFELRDGDVIVVE
jgi:polysaccharide export outer membrane protein